MALTVSLVLPGSIAKKQHICVGDQLLEMNGEPIKDFIDFIYFEAQEAVTMRLRNRDGKERMLRIRKGETEHIGIAFENDGVGVNRSCINKCIFCFIDQLP